MTAAQRRLCLWVWRVVQVASALVVVLWLPLIVRHVPSEWRFSVLTLGGAPTLITALWLYDGSRDALCVQEGDE